MLRVAHDQAVARQCQKLTAPLRQQGVHRRGRNPQPNTEPSRGEGLDGSATAEERDNYHRDAYEDARNHASGPPAARE